MELKLTKKEVNFLTQSNYIEGEYSEIAYNDSVNAWHRARCCSKLDIFLMSEIHNRLLSRLNPKIAGRFRKCNVRVGNRVCPPHEQVIDLLCDWLDKYKGARSWKKIREAHVEFEKIHPFEDGNGRTGRIIMNWMRLRASLPILVIKESEKFEYYKWFKEPEDLLKKFNYFI